MIPMPIVTKESAKLKTYQCRSPIIKSRKSTTSPSNNLSIKFPTAPARIMATPDLRIIFSSLIVQRYQNKITVRMIDIAEKIYMPNGKLIPKAIPSLVI